MSKYDVVKSQRGGNGKWFDHAATRCASESDARAYAARFAAEQRAAGVTGTRISVRVYGRTVAAHNINRGDVPAARANADVEYTVDEISGHGGARPGAGRPRDAAVGSRA